MSGGAGGRGRAASGRARICSSPGAGEAALPAPRTMPAPRRPAPPRQMGPAADGASRRDGHGGTAAALAAGGGGGRGAGVKAEQYPAGAAGCAALAQPPPLRAEPAPGRCTAAPASQVGAPRGPPRAASGPRGGKKFLFPSPRLRYRLGWKNSTSHGSERRPRPSETGLVPRRASSTAALVAPVGAAASQSKLQHTVGESDTSLRARDGEMPHPHATKLPLCQVRSAGPKASPER